ncbi:S8 family peptidase [Deinococcus soli (ex Cha et al. 2016)]|uniref:Subtilisin family serine protease n=2 Tax=Deinococcus soli (ex Cha et al. 2016) TaxID=1309411 RepID=A0ACC6KJL8_9DEIO|nr:S8 family peptidase [Deinococcus soli (ex Cha et al. 2016)]MDR6219688.1 subtilisin family serine protease [Deinococcus soli (ex Cha et al. 2016)]MDR6329711.1 subtilisin family serine protease [Deinococcus soli (ex Cha et al. 2016)]MDR6752596.1 subtilisin family serine protease [Deinococcus soli (ex Cha et al. 2016)]
MNRTRLFGLLTLSVLLAACGQTPAQLTPDAPQASAPTFVDGELLVQLKGGVSSQALTSLSALGVQNVETLATVNGAALLRARITDGQGVTAKAQQLQASGLVRFAEPNWTYQTQALPSDISYTNGTLWGMKGNFGSGAETAWAAGKTGSKSVYVGIIDEGYQFDHPDLRGNAWMNPFDPADGRDNDGNGYVDDSRGWDFANNDSTVYDGGTRGSLDAHGTHVAGTIGGTANDGGVVGVNHNVTFISGKFLGRRGGNTADAIKAVDYFTDLKTRHGLNIVATNNSWGGGGYSQAMYEAIVRAAKANILFVAAAGNSGTNNDTTASYPSNYDTTAGAGYDAVIAVAAIDKAGALASFSQYGKTTVDIGAPGVAITSSVPYNTYSSYNGTSMATPHVTGGVALYASINPGASAAQIRSAILGSATPTTSLSGKTVTGGRLNVSGF